jgi:hypothetical protein
MATGGSGSYEYAFAISRDADVYMPFGGNEATQTYTPTLPGTYRIRATVTDAYGSTDIAYSSPIMVSSEQMGLGLTVSANRSAITGTEMVVWSATPVGTISNNVEVWMEIWKDGQVYMDGINGPIIGIPLSEPGIYTCSATMMDGDISRTASAVGGTVVVAVATDMAYTTKMNTSIRSGPGINYDEVATIFSSTSYVQITGDSIDGWYPVYWFDNMGYMLAEDLHLT